MQEKG